MVLTDDGDDDASDDADNYSGDNEDIYGAGDNGTNSGVTDDWDGVMVICGFCFGEA